MAKNSGGHYPEQLTVGFPRNLYDQFERVCEKNGFGKDEVVRTLVDDFVEKYKPEDDSAEDSDQLEAFQRP